MKLEESMRLGEQAVEVIVVERTIKLTQLKSNTGSRHNVMSEFHSLRSPIWSAVSDPYRRPSEWFQVPVISD
jgi:hypothetical protein